MKRIITLAFIAMALSSCKKDNTSKTPATVSIVGKWSYTKERTQVLSATGAVISDETITSFTADDYMQFNADGTGVVSAAGGDMLDFSYTITGNTITEYQTPIGVGETPYVFTFVLTGTTLALHSETIANNETSIFDDNLTK